MDLHSISKIANMITSAGYSWFPGRVWMTHYTLRGKKKSLISSRLKGCGSSAQATDL